MGKLHKELKIAHEMVTKMDKQKHDTAWSSEVSCLYMCVHLWY